MSAKKSDSDLFHMVNVLKAGLLETGLTESMTIFTHEFMGRPELWNDRFQAIIQRGLKALEG